MLFFFFFNDTATTEIYTLSLHDALPISEPRRDHQSVERRSARGARVGAALQRREDRKSTRLNSSHSQISYAVFCLKKKKERVLLVASLGRTSAHTFPTICDDRVPTSLRH